MQIPEVFVMKQRKKNPVLIIFLISVFLVFLFAAIQLGIIFFRYYKEDSAYSKLEAFANIGEETPFKENDTYVSPIDFSSLSELNPDVIGWIYFETMDVNYPIVQGEDNDFYLHHGFYKEENNSGCIFMDTESSPDFSSENSFIYGHNMKNQSMFARLNQYAEESFFQENKTFVIYTPTSMMRYEIYSCYPARLDLDSFTYRFDTQDEYAKWMETVKGRSLYETGVTPDASEKTVTLMTCTPKGSNYRFLVHGRLME